jgi:hypothetical protein
MTVLLRLRPLHNASLPESQSDSRAIVKKQATVFARFP